MKNGPPQSNGLPMGGLLQSGIVFSAISFLTTLVHYVFQIIISRQLGGEAGECGLALTTITFVGFLGLPLAIATQAVTHYVARFHFSGDDARLQGLLAGCRKFLFHITLAGSVIAIILVKPLGDFFHIPRPSLTLITLACVLGGLWGFHSKLEPNDKALLANLLPGSWRVSLSHAKINTQTYWFNNHSEDGQGLAFAFVGQLVVGAFPGGKDAARQWHPLSGAKG
jgi:hypothetical protein